MFDFPRLQLAFTAFLAIVLYRIFFFKGLRSHYVVLFLLFAALAYQAYRIFPYTPMSAIEVLPVDPTSSQEKDRISILVCNVYQYNEEFGQLLREIDQWQPDVVLTMETDKKWQKALDVLKEDKQYVYTKEVPLDNTYGMLLHSRLPLSQTEVKYLVQDDIPSIHSLVELPSGKQVQLYCVHPRPPVPTEMESSEERDAEIVLIGKAAKEIDVPVIVAGDFNDVAWSPTTRLFQEVSTLLDPRVGRGFFNTFNARYPLLRWPLDHFFHSNDFKLIDIQRLPDVNSDHFPIYIYLQFDSQAPFQQEGQAPDEETEKEAEETVRKGMQKED